MKVQLQLRRDTLENWDTANPILKEGEVGLVLSSSEYRVGDGTTAWKDLTSYYSSPTEVAEGSVFLTGDSVELTEDSLIIPAKAISGENVQEDNILLEGATTSLAGLMTAEDKTQLSKLIGVADTITLGEREVSSYLNGAIIDAGDVATSSIIETWAARSEVAGNTKLHIILYTVSALSQNGMIIQHYKGKSSITNQWLYLGNTVYMRNVTGVTGEEGVTTKAYSWGKTNVMGIKGSFSGSNLVLTLVDYNQEIVYTSDAIPLSLKTINGESIIGTGNIVISSSSSESSEPNNSTIKFTQNGTVVGSITLNQSSDDIIPFTDTTYSTATTSAVGLMSANDKKYLDALYNNAVLGGSVELGQNIANKAYIGYYSNGNQYAVDIPIATQEQAGFMSTTDKTKLDNLSADSSSVQVIDMSSLLVSNSNTDSGGYYDLVCTAFGLDASSAVTDSSAGFTDDACNTIISAAKDGLHTFVATSDVNSGSTGHQYVYGIHNIQPIQYNNTVSGSATANYPIVTFLDEYYTGMPSSSSIALTKKTKYIALFKTQCVVAEA